MDTMCTVNITFLAPSHQTCRGTKPPQSQNDHVKTIQLVHTFKLDRTCRVIDKKEECLVLQDFDVARPRKMHILGIAD
jgi:hypothetical protein